MNGQAHLDHEQLSAVVDGEPDPSGAAHLEGCEECRRRAVAWSHARRLMAGGRPLPPASQREVAVEAALAVWASGGEAPGGGGEAPQHLVSAAAPEPVNAQGPPGGAHGRLRHRRRLVAQALAAAAVLAVAVAGATAALGHQRSSSGGVSASRAAAEASSGAAGGPSHPVPGPARLGAFAGPASLAAALRVQLRSSLIGAGTAPGRPLSCAAAARQAASEPPQAAPGASSQPSAGVIGGVVYQATLIYGGSPAEVFVFATSGGHLALVRQVPGCASLARVAL